MFSMHEIGNVKEGAIDENEDALVAIYDFLREEVRKGVVGAMHTTDGSCYEDGIVAHHCATSIAKRRGVATGQAYSIRGVRIAKDGPFKGSRLVRMRVPSAALHLHDITCCAWEKRLTMEGFLRSLWPTMRTTANQGANSLWFSKTLWLLSTDCTLAALTKQGLPLSTLGKGSGMESHAAVT